VKLVPVSMKAIRDPDPTWVKQVLAPRFPTPPKIDGTLDEWKQVPGVQLGAEHARSATYGGTADLSAVCKWAWDDKALYFAALVHDNEFRFLDDTSQLSDLWKFDAIQMAFDAAHDARGAGYDDNDYEYGFGLAGGKGRAFRWQTGNNLPLGDVSTVDVFVKPDGKQHTLTYEVAIPWKELLPFSPRQPHCGMALTINDNDGGQPMRAWMEWTPGIAGAKDPGAFGELTLVNSRPKSTEVLVWIAGESDFSNRDEATFTAHVQSPVTLSKTQVGWSVTSDGGKVESVVRDVKVAAGSQQFDFTLPLKNLGSGTYRVKVSLHGKRKTLAEASTEFFRFDVTRLTQRLDAVKARQEALWLKLTETQKQVRRLHYPQATLATAAEFVTFTAEDLKGKKYQRVEQVLGELEKMLTEAQAEMDKLLSHPELDFAVPPLTKERLTVRDGAFWTGDRPAMLLGFCGWWQVWGGTRRLARLGINCSEDSIVSPFSLFPDDSPQPDKAMMDGLDWGYLYGDESGCAYSRMLACQQVAEKFFEHHPNAKTTGSWSGLSTFDQDLRAFQEKYLTTVARVAKRHWATAAYVLWGESGHSLSADARDQQAFREFLKTKYQTIDRLNAAWGTNFASFDDPGVASKVDSPVAWYDRGVCNQRLLTDWTAWLAALVRKEDPKALVTAYPSLLSWDDSSDFSNGVDMEALCQVLDINGCDTAALEYGGNRWAMTSITGFAMVQDMLKAFRPDHPNYDPELHLVNTQQQYPPEYIRAALMQAYFHGLSAGNVWVFERRDGIDSMLTFQPRVMEATARTALDLRRLAEPILAFQRAPAQVAILHSMTSVAYNPRHLEELRSAYEGLFFLDTKVGFVTERTVQREGLRGVKLLVLPQTSHVTERAAEAIVDWVKEGGTLLVVGDGLQKNDANQPLPVALPKGDPQTLGGMSVRVAAMGKGRFVFLPAGQDLGVYHQLGEALLDRAGVSRSLRVKVNASGAPHGVEMRSAETASGTRLIYVINMNKVPVEVSFNQSVAGFRDLLTGKRVAEPEKLEPLQVLLLGSPATSASASPEARESSKFVMGFASSSRTKRNNG
ncbi:MAG: beta-galactosidase, partial [Armatimonadetes bacterium]|nr:beta-galactosidase [Armatimonadota bacterium]